MFPTLRLFSTCRITLFTRESCGLCCSAKSVLAQVHKTRPFTLREIDIIQPEAHAWRELYDFDVPVIHISKADTPEELPGLASTARKIMHRFTQEEVNAAMDKIENA